jgi:hypothetical protein
VREILGAPASQKLVALLPVGFPATPPKPKSKPGLEKVLHWERY